jgi:spore maturation protein CgeB
MKILSVGIFPEEVLVNTALHRTWALEKIAKRVDRINTYTSKGILISNICQKIFVNGFPVYIPDFANANKLLIDKISSNLYDIIWIDKGITIHKKTIKKIRQISSDTIIIGYSPDLMSVRHNQSQQFIESLPFYDFFVTTKSYSIAKLYELGCKKVIYVDNSYEETFHFPREVSKDDRERLGGIVGFIGAWEKERAEYILYLAKNGIPIRVFGGGKWEKLRGLYTNLRIESSYLFNQDYAIALSAFDISLCFLRKINSDQQTTRSIEIPACRGFMLAERTSEHQALFKENIEAVFFSTKEELLFKCKYYIEHRTERRNIAEAGLLRCLSSEYSNVARIEKIIKEVMSKHN